MNKCILTIVMMIMVSTTVNSIMADNKPCSRSRLMWKAQKNQQQAQQEQMGCRQGNGYMCKKAQDDFQDARKYQMKAMRCPFP
jgi:type II secretory pathway component PulK